MKDAIIDFLKKYLPRPIKKIIKKLRYIILNPIVTIMDNRRKLNIGAGVNRLPGFIHIDMDPRTKPDIVRNIEKGLPFDDNSVEEIYCSHTLEHINDLIYVMREFYRVSKNGAKMTLIVPLMDMSDMTHVRLFDEKTFRAMTGKEYWNENNGYYVGKYKEISRSTKPLSTCHELIVVFEVIK